MPYGTRYQENMGGDINAEYNNPELAAYLSALGIFGGYNNPLMSLGLGFAPMQNLGVPGQLGLAALFGGPLGLLGAGIMGTFFGGPQHNYMKQPGDILSTSVDPMAMAAANYRMGANPYESLTF